MAPTDEDILATFDRVGVETSSPARPSPGVEPGVTLRVNDRMFPGSDWDERPVEYTARMRVDDGSTVSVPLPSTPESLSPIERKRQDVAERLASAGILTVAISAGPVGKPR